MKATFNVPAISVIDNIILTDKEAWAYYILAEKHYTFLSYEAKVNLMYSTISSLSNLCRSGKPVACHLLVSNEPFDPIPWQEEMTSRFIDYHKRIGLARDIRPFQAFMNEQTKELYVTNYLKRVTYLGVKIADRNALADSLVNPLEVGFKELFLAFKTATMKALQFKEKEIDSYEEQRLKMFEQGLYDNLVATGFISKRATSEECLLTIKRRFYPAMPAPYLDVDTENRIGLADIVRETGHQIKNHARYLEITQMYDDMEIKGYRATLSLSKVPKEQDYPASVAPFMYRASVLPYTVNCRFFLTPSSEMKKQLHNKQLETQDELNNLNKATAQASRAPASVRETLEDQETLERILNDDNTPWVMGHYRITVEADSLEALRSSVAMLQADYAKNDFVLNWTSGDQLELLEEEFLGGSVKVKDFTQTTNLAMLGTAGFQYGDSVGNPVAQSSKLSKRGF